MMRTRSFPYHLVAAVLLTAHALLLLHSIRCHFATQARGEKGLSPLSASPAP